MMNAEIRNNHALVSRTAIEFLDHAVERQQCLERVALLDSDVHPLFRDYPFALHCWPWFLGPALRARLATCVERIPELIMRAIQAEFEDDPAGLAAYFSLSLPAAYLLLEREPDKVRLLQRTDGVLTASGFKVVEINAGGSIGGWQLHWMDAQYRKQAGLDSFMRTRHCQLRHIPLGFTTFLVRAMLDLGLPCRTLMLVNEEFLARDGAAAIGAIYRQALADEGQGGEMLFVQNLDECTFLANGVYYRGQRLGALLGVESAVPQTGALTRAAIAHQLVWPDNPVDGILGDKRALAMAYRHKDSALFSAQESALIEEFIPWSVAVEPGETVFEGGLHDLRTLLSTRQERFVIKIAQGAQGEDVFLGKFTAPALWLDVVARAFAGPGWLAQQYCESLPFYGQHGARGYGEFDVIWGVFGFDRQYGGAWLRLMPRGAGDGVINSAKGAQEAIVYEVAA